MQELDEIQLTSNTKDARAGRNTNTSILVAADMHATATLNQQWGWSRSILYVTGDISNLSGTAAYRVSSAGTSWQYHLAVYHKTTRLCIALSAHGSTRATCIRSNGRIQIRSNTKKYKNWTKYKYIDPRNHRDACNRSTESTMGNDIKR